MQQPLQRWRTALVIALLLPSHTICSDHDAHQPHTPQHLYEQALALRYATSSRVASMLFHNNPNRSNGTNAKTPRERQRHEARITELLHEAAGVSIVPINVTLDHGWQVAPAVEFAEHGHPEALWELAQAYMHGRTHVEPNFAIAFQMVLRCAALGHPPCQTERGLYLSWGLLPAQPTWRGTAAPAVRPLPFELSEPQPAQSLVHHFFAAGGDDDVAQVILGYRHLLGIGVPKSCQAAALYYAPVAQRVAQSTKAPGALVKGDPTWLAGTGGARAVQGGEYQVLHYQWVADRGDAQAQYAVGQLMAQLPKPRWAEAVQYYRRAAEQGNADAVAALGHAYANGLGVEQNNKTAVKLLTRAAEAGHPSGLYGLGYMYLTGHGVDIDLIKAARYLRAAGDNNVWPGAADAWFHLGVMHQAGMGMQRNPKAAASYFRMGAKVKHVPCMYNLAMLRLGSTDAEAGCAEAVLLLKHIAERGPWASVLQEGLDAHRAGDSDRALWAYLRGAEMGLESAQSNAAWLLRHSYGGSGLQSSAAQLAVAMHRLAAGQGNVDSLLELGDAYYYGRGMVRDMGRAAEMYQKAAAAKNVQALYNLGYMHEYGAGLTQDFHLAKRYYDQALHTEPKAAIPVTLALMAMSLHIRWHAILPLLPTSLQWLSSRVFTAPQGAMTRPSGQILSPAAAAGVSVLLWPFRALGFILDFSSRWLEAEWVDRVMGMIKPDTVALLALLGALYGVLRRRQQLRQRQQ